MSEFGITGGEWRKGTEPYNHNRVYGADHCDGTKQVVAEVFGVQP